MYGKSVFSCRVASICSLRYYKKGSTERLLEFLANMPKANSARIAEAQRQRQQISKKSEKYGPSTVYLQVLGSGARGVPNTLYLFTDQKRYLFNCGECTQRLSHEHKVKLSRLDHIFITNKTWKNIGGLPGLSLTLQDVGVPNITLHGPDGLDELYNATKRFVIMKDMNVTMAKCTNSEDFEDNVMIVKYVLLSPNDDILAKNVTCSPKRQKTNEGAIDKEFEEFIHDDIDYYKSEVQNELKNRHAKDKTMDKPRKSSPERDPLKKKTEQVLQELQKRNHCSVAYICTLKKRLGTLDLNKCVELGVKPGPMLGQLKNGQDVVLPDGTLVLSKDVKMPDDPGPVFIVLDVPEISYLKESEFSAHFDNGQNPPKNIPTLIVHFTPPHVFHNPIYRTFMTMFGAATRHLVLNSQNSCLGSEAVHRTQHKLHLLDPDIFPMLKDVSVPAVWNAQPPEPKAESPERIKGLEELKNKIAIAQFQNIINMESSCKIDGRPLDDIDSITKLELITGRTLTMFHLRPKIELDRSSEPKLHIQDYIQETMNVDGFASSLEQFRRLVDNMRYAKLGSQIEYPKVAFMGTGSCIPSKTRNTSAIVLHIDEKSSMLLDCGEGTFGQMVRFYGPRRVNAFLRTLKAIYISHLHADHHIGLIGVLQARREAFAELDAETQPDPIYLLAPGQIVTWLSVYDQQFERIRGDFTLIPNQNLLQESPNRVAELTSAVLANIGVQEICTCYVPHCPNAFGVAIDVTLHHKITYSGDTLPCENLVKIGQNSTLLIHEATMEDELIDEARMKMHSTTSQAIDIGRQMNAKYTLLTHFSQRYARLPRLNAHILHDNNSVGIAFDNMQITMSDLELLPHMYAPLQLMFADHCVEMELKAAQRARHKQKKQLPLSQPSAAARRYRKSSPNSTTPRSRSPSPTKCRNVTSAPTTRPAASYMETYSSRLRQEMKGMTVTGIVRKSLRSKSTSPVKKSPPQNKSPGSAQNIGLTSPIRRDDSPEKTVPHLVPPRTMSDISNMCKDAREKLSSNISKMTKERFSNMSKNNQERPITNRDAQQRSNTITLKKTQERTASNIQLARDTIDGFTTRTNSSCVVDTRSKTISTVGRSSTCDFINTMTSCKKATVFTTSCDFVNAYGKPLVTPVNKRLAIRRDVPTLCTSITKAKTDVKNRSKSPESSSPPWKTNNKRTIPGNKLYDAKAKSDTKSVRRTGVIKPKPVTTQHVSKFNRSPPRQAKSMEYKSEGNRNSASCNKSRSSPAHQKNFRDMKDVNKPVTAKETIKNTTKKLPSNVKTLPNPIRQS